MTMTAEQLEELLGKVTQGEWSVKTEKGCGVLVSCESEWHVYSITSNVYYHNATLIALAPSLARRVIAAERLVEAAEKVANMDDATRAFDAAMEVLCERAIAYREARK